MKVLKGQVFRTLVDIDVACLVHLPPVLTKETRVVLRAGELFAVTFVAPFESLQVSCRPRRYDALEPEFVDTETRQDPNYQGYRLSVDVGMIDRDCEPVEPGDDRSS